MSKRDEFTSAQKKEILNRAFKGKTHITDVAGRRVKKSQAEIDHIVPASKGGKATYKNAQVLHPKTNIEKGNKMSGTLGPESRQVVFKVNPKTQTMTTKKKK